MNNPFGTFAGISCNITMLIIRDFIYQLQDAGQKKGLIFEGCSFVYYFKHGDSLDKTFKDFKRQNLKLIIAILDERNISYSKFN